jgi:acetoin utilization deacetylase AcuC-like enzyme
MLKIAWSSIYAHPLPDGHRFPMEKYNLIPEQLLYEGTVCEDNFFEPVPLPEQWITQTHSPEYWHKLSHQLLTPSEVRKTGFPMSPELVAREVIIMQGTLQSALYALEFGVSCNIAGGTHHAFTDRGEGFCLLNDIAIAANYLLATQQARKILVIDLDVHQGNGTAQIFQQNSSVFTFSMHGASNYPMHKEQSDLDIALPDQTEDAAYLKLLQYHLPQIIDNFQPDFVFFQSGVDVLKTDALGRLALSTEGCYARDKYVLETCQKNKIPVAISMGGGYSPRIADIVEAHANTYRLAQSIFF